MLPDMKKMLEEGLKNIAAMEEYIDLNIKHLDRRIQLFSWIDQIRVALATALINTREITNLGEKIEISKKLDIISHNLLILTKRKLDWEPILDDIQKKTKCDKLEIKKIFNKEVKQKNGR